MKLLPYSKERTTLFPPRCHWVGEFIRRRIGGYKHYSRRVSHKMMLYLLLLLPFLLRLLFVLSAMKPIEAGAGDTNCSSIGCMGKMLNSNRSGRERRETLAANVEEICDILGEQYTSEEYQEMISNNLIPKSLDELLGETRTSRLDARTFALKLKSLVRLLEEKSRTSKIQEYLYRHVASNSIPKQLHCLSLALSDEYASKSAARRQIPAAERIATLVDNRSMHHFVIASDNVLATSVVATSLVRNSREPHRVAIHVITDRKTFAAMHAWFSLHPLDPAVMQVKGLHHFGLFAGDHVVPVMEVMEKARSTLRSRGGLASTTSHNKEEAFVIAAKLQALSPKYNSIMNHVRIYLPELFPRLRKVVFLDDDVVVQADLSGLWDVDLKGKVNGAVETCRGADEFVMSKRFKNYLNFSHPLIAKTFDPDECAWAYGMNVFDLDAWRRTNITLTYHSWIQKNLMSEMSLWRLGTLPPGLIAFHGHVHVIDPSWHMLGLGYQENTSVTDVAKAAVAHFNGRAKPWLDIAFPHLRPIWSKYVDFSDRFIKACDVRPS